MSELVPPSDLWFVGDGDYTRVGQLYREHFIRLGGLKPHERVLDVGCGVGRMAVPLLDYLDERGSYEGFDIVRKGIEWCQRNITTRNSRFRFRHADIYNGTYNPRGVYCPANYRFPYAAGSFDFVFLTSVFTHMLPDDVESYLAEINRVLKKGGRMLATFFLLDAQVEECIRAGRSRSAFAHDRGNCRLGNAAHPEEGVAYQVDSVRSLCARYGLTVQEPIAFGYWSGRIPNVDYQDIVVAAKERDVRQPFRLRRVLSRLKSGIRRFFRRITERDEEIVIRQAPK